MCDGEDCCKRFAKFLLVVINLFFFLLGLLMLAFGIAMVVAPDKVAVAVQKTGADLSILGDSSYIIKGSGIFMIILGGIVTLIGAFGFFGACCENKVLLVLYLIIVILILLAEVALIIFAACFPANLRGKIQEDMKKSMFQKYSQDIRVYPNVTIDSNCATCYGWTATQFGAKCCGSYGPQDYYNYSSMTSPYSESNRTIIKFDGTPAVAYYPISCCKLKGNTKFTDIKSSNDFENFDGCLSNAKPDYIYTQNCYDAIDGMVTKASNIAIGIAAAIVGLQIIIIILGFILCCSMHSKSLTV